MNPDHRAEHVRACRYSGLDRTHAGGADDCCCPPLPSADTVRVPDGARFVNWAFFMDGDLTLEDCRGWEIWCGSVWLNVYNLVVPPDPHPGWPSLAKAPNGLPVFARPAQFDGSRRA